MLLCWPARVSTRAASNCCVQRRNNHREQCASWGHAYGHCLKISFHPDCMPLLSSLGVCQMCSTIEPSSRGT